MKDLHKQLHEHLTDAFAVEKDNQDYEKMMLVAQLVIDAVKKSLADDVYWDIGKIAKYLGVSTSTVYRHFVNDPRFPTPIVWGEGKLQKKLWLASECREAISKFREKPQS